MLDIESGLSISVVGDVTTPCLSDEVCRKNKQNLRFERIVAFKKLKVLKVLRSKIVRQGMI